MIRSAVTISLVDEARGGPFVFWDDLPAACRTASQLGFDAIEIFAPSGSAVGRQELRGLLDQHKLQLAAVGTGAGMVVHGLSLTDPNPQQRQKASRFVREIIDFGAPFGAPAIIGSMQGKWGGELGRDAAHWSALMHAEGSVQDGNAWRDNEDGTFTLTDSFSRFSTLDLYAMGMIAPERVESTCVLNNLCQFYAAHRVPRTEPSLR